LPDTAERRLDDVLEAAKPHVRAKGEHPFFVIKQQFGFHKTRLHGMDKKRREFIMPAALTNLFHV
jgi:IS5 family transposase